MRQDTCHASFLSPSGVTPSMYALHCNDCSWGLPKSTDEPCPSALDSRGQLLERPAPTEPCQWGQASRCSHARQIRYRGSRDGSKGAAIQSGRVLFKADRIACSELKPGCFGRNTA